MKKMHFPMRYSYWIAGMYHRRWELERKAAIEKSQIEDGYDEFEDPGGKIVGKFDRCELCRGTGIGWTGWQCGGCEGDGLKRLEINPPPTR